MLSQLVTPPRSLAIPGHLLAGYTHRELIARTYGLAVGASVEILLGPRQPAWLQSIGCLGSQPEGFSLQLVDDVGRMFAAPLQSLLFAPGTVQNLTLNRKRYDRLLLGAVRVQVRNLAALAQDCDVCLSIAEPDGPLVPSDVQRYADQAWAAPDQAEGVAVLGGSAAPSGTAGNWYTPPVILPNLMQSRPLDISVNNGLALVLEAQPVAVQVHSLFLLLDGAYPASCSITFFAETPQGVSRKLCGTFLNIGAATPISFQFQDQPHFLLQPGERMTISHSSTTGDLAIFGGQIKFRTL